MKSGPIYLWVDDFRPMPKNFNVHAKTANEAIALIDTGRVVVISLDHDLGPPEAGTGYDIARHIEVMAFKNTIPPIRWMLHTANPVGMMNMHRALTTANMYWLDHGHSVP